MSEEYIKVKIATFYRFVYFLSALVDYSVSDKAINEFLQSFISDLEKEVIRCMDGET